MELLSALHPIFIHFPIVIFLLYIVFEILGLFREQYSNTALILLILGVVAGVAAVLTGNQAAEVIEKSSQISKLIPKELLEEHENYATIALWFFFALSALRIYLTVKKKFTQKIKIVIIALAIIGYLFVFETAAHGGKLVYDFGAGTTIIKNINDKN